VRWERGTRTLGIVSNLLRQRGKDVRFRGLVFKHWAIGVLTVAPKTDLSRGSFE
jgi:hypothetical protein